MRATSLSKKANSRLSERGSMVATCVNGMQAQYKVAYEISATIDRKAALQEDHCRTAGPAQASPSSAKAAMWWSAAACAKQQNTTRVDAARRRRQFSGDSAHGDARRAIGREAINAGRDRRKCDRGQADAPRQDRARCDSRTPADPSSPLPPPLQTGPTAWMTCFAGSR